MRDPFVLVSREESRYYLYGTTDSDPWHGDGVGFDAFYSEDLQRFNGPHPVFRPSPGFWGTRNFWAPEVYRLDGAFYMLASFKSDDHARAVQILRAESPLGPFVEHSEPVTPPGWECLDGTLCFEGEVPWLVFCHEWLQINDGAICRVQLTPDLAKACSVPEVLFTASEAAWVRPVQEKYHFVTDGPFVHRGAGNSLLLIWSSFASSGYAVGLSCSESGCLSGPWKHRRRPIYRSRNGREGGHAMVFEDLKGRLAMALHSPNDSPFERPQFFAVDERPCSLKVLGELDQAATQTSAGWWPWTR